jgi:hypothetical protein
MQWDIHPLHIGRLYAAPGSCQTFVLWARAILEDTAPQRSLHQGRPVVVRVGPGDPEARGCLRTDTVSVTAAGIPVDAHHFGSSPTIGQVCVGWGFIRRRRPPSIGRQSVRVGCSIRLDLLSTIGRRGAWPCLTPLSRWHTFPGSSTYSRGTRPSLNACERLDGTASGPPPVGSSWIRLGRLPGSLSRH